MINLTTEDYDRISKQLRFKKNNKYNLIIRFELNNIYATKYTETFTYIKYRNQKYLTPLNTTIANHIATRTHTEYNPEKNTNEITHIIIFDKLDNEDKDKTFLNNIEKITQIWHLLYKTSSDSQLAESVCITEIINPQFEKLKDKGFYVIWSHEDVSCQFEKPEIHVRNRNLEIKTKDNHSNIYKHIIYGNLEQVKIHTKNKYSILGLPSGFKTDLNDLSLINTELKITNEFRTGNKPSDMEDYIKNLIKMPPYLYTNISNNKTINVGYYNISNILIKDMVENMLIEDTDPDAPDTEDNENEVFKTDTADSNSNTATGNQKEDSEKELEKTYDPPALKETSSGTGGAQNTTAQEEPVEEDTKEETDDNKENNDNDNDNIENNIEDDTDTAENIKTNSKIMKDFIGDDDTDENDDDDDYEEEPYFEEEPDMPF